MIDLLERLERAVALQNDDAAIRIRAEYEPAAGPTAKVFPPTYLPSDGSRYNFEERWDEAGERVRVVLLDSFQSQANRAEVALRDEAEALGLPQHVAARRDSARQNLRQPRHRNLTRAGPWSWADEPSRWYHE